MLLRQLPRSSSALREFLASPDITIVSNGEPVDSMYLSMTLAHIAVRFQPNSGRAWECLGNALFTALHGEGFLTRSLAAFSQAAKHSTVVGHPHFHFNRAAALNYVVGAFALS